MNAIILFGHGARNPEYAEPFRRIRAAMLARAPQAVVEIGFLDLTAPFLDEVIDILAARGAARIRVVPIFFAPGRHVLKDLPQLIANAMDRHPGVEFEVSPCIGEVPAVVDAMADFALSR